MAQNVDRNSKIQLFIILISLPVWPKRSLSEPPCRTLSSPFIVNVFTLWGDKHREMCRQACIGGNQQSSKLKTLLGLVLNLLFSCNVRMTVPLPGVTIDEVSLFLWHLVGSRHRTPNREAHRHHLVYPKCLNATSHKDPQRHCCQMMGIDRGTFWFLSLRGFLPTSFSNIKDFRNSWASNPFH